MTGFDTRFSGANSGRKSTGISKLIVHALLLIYGSILAYIVGSLIFQYQPNPNFYFALSFALFLFALGQSFYELGSRRTLILLLIGTIIGFAFEVLGTTTGFLFGKYSYSSLLGEQVLGVPIVVPLGWFVITFITLSLALPKFSRKVPSQQNNVNVLSPFKIKSLVTPIILASFGTVAWDLMIDPMFSHYGYWTWAPYSAMPHLYDVPVSNFVGWFVVALIVLTTFIASLKFGSGNPSNIFKKSNTWDSRIAYLLLMIDGAVANATLNQFIAVIIGLIAMSVFVIITFDFATRERRTMLKREESLERIDGSPK
jgi:uncharacterized membrane protein